MWDLPGPGLESVSLALAGEFLTTVPPGKPQELLRSTLLATFKYTIQYCYVNVNSSCEIVVMDRSFLQYKMEIQHHHAELL